MSASLRALEPWLQPYAAYLLRLYPPAVVTSTYRSYTEQLELYRNRSRNPYPVAPPCCSWHEFGRAFDVAAPTWALEQLGAIWMSWGGTWSADDRIHFQA